MQHYHEKTMLEETEMFGHLEDGGISAILVDSADDSLQGAGDHLCGHNGACVPVDKGINAMIVTPASEAVIT
jgi:hypothetical protein